MRWTRPGIGVGLGFACAPRLRSPALDVNASSSSVARAREAQARCRSAVAAPGDDVREPCALVCTTERLLPPVMKRAPHRASITFNDAGLQLDVAHLEDGGFSCARTE